MIDKQIILRFGRSIMILQDKKTQIQFEWWDEDKGQSRIVFYLNDKDHVKYLEKIRRFFDEIELPYKE